MRFVWAVAAFVLAALMIGAGIAQRTVFQGPEDRDRVDLGRRGRSVPPHRRRGAQPCCPALRRCAHRARATSSPPTAARPTCRPGWPTPPTTQVSLDGDGRDRHRARSLPTRAEDDAADGRGDAAPSPAPEAGDATEAAAGAQPDRLRPVARRVPADRHPDRAAPASRGDERARRDRRRRRRPVGGHRLRGRSRTRRRGPVRSSWAARILMAIGVFLYILGIRHARRSRGPRRKGLPLPVTEPIDLAVEGADKGVISATPTRAAPCRAVAAPSPSCPPSPSPRCCSPAARPTPGRSWRARRRPAPTATVIAPEGQQAPAVTEGAGRAHHRAHRRDRRRRRREPRRALAATRLDGAVLADARDELRAARRDRRLQGPRRHPDQAARDRPAAGVRRLAPLGHGRRRRRGDEDLEHHGAHAAGCLVAVQAHVPGEPRGVDADARPRARSTSARRRCRRTRRSSSCRPDELAAAYADVINKGEDSEFFDMFEAEGDHLRESIAADRQRRLDEFNKTAATTGSLTFASDPGSAGPVRPR